MLIQSITGQRTAAAAAAPGDIHPRLVHEALRHQRVRAAHQIVEVGASIVVVDAVDEAPAVARAASRIEIQRHEAVGGEIPPHVVEAGIVVLPLWDGTNGLDGDDHAVFRGLPESIDRARSESRLAWLRLGVVSRTRATQTRQNPP